MNFEGINLIDMNYDEIAKSYFSMYSVKLSKLKEIVLSWHYGIDFSKFDERYYYRESHSNKNNLKLMKQTIRLVASMWRSLGYKVIFTQ